MSVLVRARRRSLAPLLATAASRLAGPSGPAPRGARPRGGGACLPAGLATRAACSVRPRRLALWSARRSCSTPGRGTVDPLSIAYASRPGLRSRLTPGGRTCPGKPWDSGDRDSRPVFRYSCPHNLWTRLHGRSPARFGGASTLPYRPDGPAGSARGLTPDHFRRGASRPVSCYALFKWWLPLSQHPGCP